MRRFGRSHAGGAGAENCAQERNNADESELFHDLVVPCLGGGFAASIFLRRIKPNSERKDDLKPDRVCFADDFEKLLQRVGMLGIGQYRLQLDVVR